MKAKRPKTKASSSAGPASGAITPRSVCDPHPVHAQCSSVVHGAGRSSPSVALDGSGTFAARASLRFRLLLALLDDFVLAIMGGGGNAGGTGSSEVASIGVESTHSSSSSSRTAESNDEVVRENPTTAFVLCEIGLALPSRLVS